MEAPQSEGILTAWLRRNAKAPASPPAIPEATSPTWSDEASEGGHDESFTPSPAPLQAMPSPLRPTSPVQPERISWLTRLSGAYNIAVRGGAKALQKLTARDRLRDYNEARERLERTAAELEGSARIAALQKWAGILVELCSQPPFHLPSAAPMSPASHSSDPDWQQLQASSAQSGPAAVPTAAPAAAPAPAQEGRGLDWEGGLKASEVLFVDWTQPGSEPITFRELFLRSHVLHILTAGYAVRPAAEGTQEAAALSQLFSACLSGDAALHDRLAGLVLQASATLAACRHAGTDKANRQSISDAMVRAVSALKLKAEVEVLDRKMGLLKQDIAAQAAAAAQQHKFNSGSAEPSGDCSPQKLAFGVAATAEVMQLAEKLAQLGQQRQALVLAAAQPQIEASLAHAQQRLQQLEAELQQAEGRTSDTRRQQQEGESFRGKKLTEMDQALAEVSGEVATLDERKAALLSQLAQVDAQLAQAHARKADLDEGRNVFEEGNSFTLDALQHQLDELSLQQRKDSAETAALSAGAAVLSTVQAGHAISRLADESAAERVAEEAMREYGHAATRHLYFQRAQGQLLLRQLRFCSSELQGSASKQEHMSQMGMGRLLADVQAQRLRLQQQYLDAEATALSLFADISAVQAALHAAAQQSATVPTAFVPIPSTDSTSTPGGAASAASPASETSATSPVLSEELQGLLATIEQLREAFEDRERPSGLPQPGQPLPEPQLEAGEGGTAAAAGATSEGSAASLPDPQVISVPELGGVALPEVPAGAQAAAVGQSGDAAHATVLDPDDSSPTYNSTATNALSADESAANAASQHASPAQGPDKGSDSADSTKFLSGEEGDESDLVDAGEELDNM